ncbi:MAG: sigma 54-interacting transcriptional regulator [Mariprofundaceae bacterium]|nr:sigma 54-interacting transcriptional regulator [Mariprofundaceae bacterium]
MNSITLPDLAFVIDNLEEGVLFLDRERRVVTINKAALDMIGQPPSEAGGEAIVGQLCPSLFPGASCARECEESGNCSLMQQDTKKEKLEDITFRRPDNRIVSLRLRALALSPSEPLARCAILLTNRTHEQQLEEEVSERLRLGGLIGHSRPMQKLFRRILQAATSEATVLIEGESGTGKELVARSLHENSNRSRGPYIRVHCAALSEGLLESELFGHARGAFTGATSAREGRFEAANGGTLLLDEVGEIPLSTQVKLLRVLQEREIERVGENISRKVDVRIIAATNRNLASMVQEGTFREDLYYRLRVLPLHVPALRERRDDIPLLATHLLAEISQQHYQDEIQISQEALHALEAYDWPGNVRELSNALEFATVQAASATIQLVHLPPEIRHAESSRPHAAVSDTALHPHMGGYYRARVHGDEEKALILKVLEESGGNRAAAARKLGMSRTTLWKRLKQYGVI